ncbi:MAG TPA: nucleotidyltransferase family protein [Agriterribacter sp.]|nr:nucleotidyltransferase family protein [Agriterribacter sp.]
MPGIITEAIILAGGLGTRLRDAVPDLPKCMAPVKEVPFIAYVTEHLKQQGVRRFIFALGYKSEAFETFIQRHFPEGSYELSIEDEPLGTGGAIQLACSRSQQQNVVIANGDTLFRVELADIAAFHQQQKADCTLALKPMKAFSRYGAVELNEDQSVLNFKEKQYFSEGLINGGVYILNIPSFLQKKMPLKFSFEKDYLEKYYAAKKIFGIVQDEYFIDIGIPEDYERAQRELDFEKQ